MSEENPYGGPGRPPPEGPPPGYPAYPPGQGYPPPERSDRWKIWLGIGLAIPALLAVGVLAGVAGAVDSSGVASSIIGIGGVLAPIVMLFFRQTRKVAIGLVIGLAVTIMLFAGACVALLSSYS